MITLQAITWNNFQSLLNLRIHESQKPFVRTIPTFLAQSYVNLTSGIEDSSLAIYEGKRLIGYVKLVFVPEAEEVYAMDVDSVMIDALIIDRTHQGKGYGKATMDAIMDHIQTVMRPDTRFLSLVIFDANARAIRLTESHGFQFLKKRDTDTTMSVYIRAIA